MPRINQGLTKLLNSTALILPKGFNQGITSQLETQNGTRNVERYSNALEQISKNTGEMAFSDAKAYRLNQDFYKFVSKIETIAMSDLGKTKSGKPSLLKALKTQQAKVIVNDLDTKLNKNTNRLDILSALCDLDIVCLNKEVRTPLNESLTLLKKLLPNLREKDMQTYSESFKIPTIKMTEELFKKFHINLRPL